MPESAIRPLWPVWARNLFMLQLLLNVVMWVALSTLAYVGARARVDGLKEVTTKHALLEIRVRQLERTTDQLTGKGEDDATK
jgi:hypothetical protein